jgi:hypothetical protein
MEAQMLGNFMIPIILYIDKTKLSLTGKLTLFPVTMPLGINITEAMRCQSCAWRPLGFIANKDYFFSAAERAVNNADVKYERFHRQLEVILCSMYKAQEPVVRCMTSQYNLEMLVNVSTFMFLCNLSLVMLKVVTNCAAAKHIVVIFAFVRVAPATCLQPMQPDQI